MKRLVRIAMVALPLMTLAAPAYAEVKTRDKTQVKFEGHARPDVQPLRRQERQGGHREAGPPSKGTARRP